MLANFPLPESSNSHNSCVDSSRPKATQKNKKKNTNSDANTPQELKLSKLSHFDRNRTRGVNYNQGQITFRSKGEAAVGLILEHFFSTQEKRFLEEGSTYQKPLGYGRTADFFIPDKNLILEFHPINLAWEFADKNACKQLFAELRKLDKYSPELIENILLQEFEAQYLKKRRFVLGLSDDSKLRQASILVVKDFETLFDKILEPFSPTKLNKKVLQAEFYQRLNETKSLKEAVKTLLTKYLPNEELAENVEIGFNRKISFLLTTRNILIDCVEFNLRQEFKSDLAYSLLSNAFNALENFEDIDSNFKMNIKKLIEQALIVEYSKRYEGKRQFWLDMSNRQELRNAKLICFQDPKELYEKVLEPNISHESLPSKDEFLRIFARLLIEPDITILQ